MNRYFLYLVLLNMLMNGIMFIPKILIQHRYDGAVMSTLIAIPISIVLNYTLGKSITKFPGKGLPEIFADSKYRWLTILHLGIMQLEWFIAGLITIEGFVDILSRFINPEEPRLTLLAIYLAAIFLIIQLPTQRVMYLLEVVLFLSTPFLGFIIFKTFTSEQLSWDSILEVGTHIFEMPNIFSIAAAAYTFSGFTNLIIFNRVIKGDLRIWNFLVVLIGGIFNLITTFFIPIGFHGSDGAQEYLFPWVSTADSLRLVYSPIERVIFLFLMLYIGIALMSISVHWHVSLELAKGIFKEKKQDKPIKTWMILAGFTICSVLTVIFFNTVRLYKVTGYWLIFHMGFEIIVVVLFSIWARRKTANEKGL